MERQPVDMRSEKERVTIREVAQAAGTSIGSVSVALRGAKGVSQQTRDRILKIADELGYIPDQRARTLRQSTNRLIGVVFSLEQTFHADLVESLYTEAEDRDYDLALSGTTRRRGSADALQSLLRERVDAIIFLAQDTETGIGVTSPAVVPVVAIGNSEAADGIVRVISDDGAGMRQIFSHLQEHGHTAATYLDGGNHPAGRQRLAAAKQEARRQGITLEVQPSGPTEADGIDSGKRLVKSDLPTAVLSFNDLNALGLLACFSEAKIPVPAQVSVIGYDDARVARLSMTQLTTVRQDKEELASIAVQEAISCIEEGISVGSPLRIAKPELIVRGTTGQRAVFAASRG